MLLFKCNIACSIRRGGVVYVNLLMTNLLFDRANSNALHLEQIFDWNLKFKLTTLQSTYISKSKLSNIRSYS